MTRLIHCTGLTKVFGDKTLFRDLQLGVEEEERIGIIGANGSGKSTLLRILAGLEDPDSGERTQKKRLRVGYIEQDPHFPPGRTVFELLCESPSSDPAEDDLRPVRASAVLSRLSFPDPDQRVELLSGGWQKRLAIARALVDDPELLLLDEPTNHLDIEGILWLENLLANARFAFVMVTHDRALLQAVSRKIAELDPRYPNGILICEGDYARFLEDRESFLEARVQREQSLANRVRREIEWLRRGPKARGTKAWGRIDSARALIDELGDLRGQKPGEAAEVALASTGRKTRKLISGEKLSKSLGGRKLFSKLDILLGPGRRIGLVGANGSGKTTLLKVLAGELEPDTGLVTRAEPLEVAIFEQRRSWVDPSQSLKRALAPDGDAVLYRGQAQHVVTWARRFGFRPDQLDTEVGKLSGGEQARIAIARLVQRAAEVLLLDEPTNDLDIPTLESLEQALLDFPGAVVLVTHDRYLMDRVADTMIGLDGRGGHTEIADVAQWERLVQEGVRQREKAASPREPVARPAPELVQEPRLKPLTWAERKEFGSMEQRILEAEERAERARSSFEDPSIVTNAAELAIRQTALHEADTEVTRLYDRWAELEARDRSKK